MKHFANIFSKKINFIGEDVYIRKITDNIILVYYVYKF